MGLYQIDNNDHFLQVLSHQPSSSGEGVYIEGYESKYNPTPQQYQTKLTKNLKPSNMSNIKKRPLNYQGDTPFSNEAFKQWREKFASKDENGSHCHICPKTFALDSSLRRHYKQVHEIICKFCSLQFSEEHLLQAHHRENHEYWCFPCNKNFALKSSLHRHNKQHHGGQPQGTPLTTPEMNADCVYHIPKSMENYPNHHNEYITTNVNAEDGTPASSYSEDPNTYYSSDGVYFEGDNSGQIHDGIDDNGLDTFKNEDFDNEYYETEDQEIYYEGEGSYETGGIDQGSISMPEHYTEENSNEFYENEEGYYEGNDTYESSNLEDTPIPEEPYNTTDGLSNQYQESNDQGECYYNEGAPETSQLDNSSLQYPLEGNEYYDTENTGYYNDNGEYVSNEVDCDPNYYNYTEGLGKGKSGVKRSKGASGNYSCPQCAKSFSNKSNLNRHINSTHCFPCKACGQKFVDKTMMEVHYKQEHLINCHICSKTFSNKSNLNRHIKQNHAIT